MFRYKRVLFFTLIFGMIFWGGCVKEYRADRFEIAAANNVLDTDPSPTATPKQIDPNISSLPASSLCDRLGEIEVIHDRVPDESDDLYKAIIAKGSEALPCLIEKINDRTKTSDPRTAPKWQHYVVGDTAVFTILDIASQDDHGRWEEMMLVSLPSRYRNEWKTNGVYAYFNYVSEPKNRKQLQKWWKKWLRENNKSTANLQ